MQNLVDEIWLLLTGAKILGVLLLLAATCIAQAPALANSPGYLDPLPQDTGAPGLKQQLQKLQTTGRLMMVTAHPDDEDGGLLTLEARGKGMQTLLLTLTRGEGGQNKIGSSLFDVLGVLRTLELLAADRYYGVEQRFTRVADFGYSKTAGETFQKWGGHDVPLQDTVRVIRSFRPDVLIARFSGTDADGHGHHQASAILTKEAFRAAADPKRFPEQIKEGLQPWQPKKLYIGNVCGFGANTCPDENWTVKINTGEEDPLLGASYVQFAIEGLRHQQSQGLGDLKIPAGPRYAFYKLVDSVLPDTKDASGHEKDLFDGIDTGLPGMATQLIGNPSAEHEMGETGGRLKAELIQMQENFEQASAATSDPGLALPALFASSQHQGKARILALSLPPRSAQKDVLLAELDEKGKQIEAAIALAAEGDLHLAVKPPPGPSRKAFLVSPGQTFDLEARFRSSTKARLKRMELVLPAGWTSHAAGKNRCEGTKCSQIFRVTVPPFAEFTRPYWRRDNPEVDSVNLLDDRRFETHPFPPPPVRGSASYVVGDKGAEVNSTAAVAYTDTAGRRQETPVAVVPPFSVALEPGEQVIPVADGKETAVKVGLHSNLRGAASGTLRLDLPAGWTAQPDRLQVTLPGSGERRDFVFKVFPANLKESRTEIRAVLQAGKNKFNEGYTLVTREDLGSFDYFQPAIQHVSMVDVKIPKLLKVGYIMGAGDDIPAVLQQIGMNVTLISAEELATGNLSQYGSIVLGIRAYDTQKKLASNNQKLLDFVSNGGTLLVQNNNSVPDFNSGHFTPYSAELSRARVSVEEAPVQILAPDDPVFHYPNEISQKDFDGWVQERGLYFMEKWDDHFKPLLACHDPNEADQKGGLLVAKFGKGTYIYTGYAFFRQLPAGVPGAIRLFVNLVSAGSRRQITD